MKDIIHPKRMNYITNFQKRTPKCSLSEINCAWALCAVTVTNLKGFSVPLDPFIWFWVAGEHPSPHLDHHGNTKVEHLDLHRDLLLVGHAQQH